MQFVRVVASKTWDGTGFLSSGVFGNSFGPPVIEGYELTFTKAGTYKFVISDKSPFHNFTVEKETGAKVEKHLTGTSFTGSKSMTLTLKAGKWKYYCSVHEPQMFGYFTVK